METAEPAASAKEWAKKGGQGLEAGTMEDEIIKGKKREKVAVLRVDLVCAPCCLPRAAVMYTSCVRGSLSCTFKARLSWLSCLPLTRPSLLGSQVQMQIPEGRGGTKRHILIYCLFIDFLPSRRVSEWPPEILCDGPLKQAILLAICALLLGGHVYTCKESVR